MKHNYMLWPTFLGWVFLFLAGCAPLGRPSTINVEFQDGVPGLREGDQVYLFDVEIGEIGTPAVVNNRVIVPVFLRDAGVFDKTGQVFFLVAPDHAKPGRSCLVAHVHTVPAEPGQPRFRGFTSNLKLKVQMESDRVRAWWKNF
jgi:hypothetical protein